jgi:hypothetical protein
VAPHGSGHAEVQLFGSDLQQRGGIALAQFGKSHVQRGTVVGVNGQPRIYKRCCRRSWCRFSKRHLAQAGVSLSFFAHWRASTQRQTYHQRAALLQKFASIGIGGWRARPHDCVTLRTARRMLG